MNRDKAKALHRQLIEAIKGLTGFGCLDVRVGKNVRYTANSVVFKIEMTEPGDSKEVKDFREYATLFGLNPEDLGRRFVSLGEEYEIAGLLCRCFKYPILVKKNGQKYKFTAETVRAGLRKSDEA